MRTSFQSSFRLSWIAAIILAVVLPALAMPPSPELMERLKSSPERPHFLQYEQELRARGINAPTLVERLRDIAGGRALDETFNVIAILVDFSDHTAQTSGAYFDNLLYGSSTGTVNHYYNQVTYGNLTLVTLNQPSSLGWYRAPQTYAYYVDGENGTGSYPNNSQRLAQDAVALANPYVDFSPYDNDGNGYIEALFIIHAGSGAEWTGSDDDIWSHKWQMISPQSVDGVYAYVYSIEPEFWSSSIGMTCGVFAHEMGHATFGLPDFYDTDGGSNGLGAWSLMAGGSWNGSSGNSPAHPDAWCRAQMGVATVTNVTANMTGVSIPAIETTPTLYRLWTSGASGNQYFLLENRRLTGYDAALPAQGLLIYHVDDSQSGNTNPWYPGYTSNGHYQVALEQADGLWQLEQETSSGDGADPFPGTTVNRTFDSGSTPDSRSYTSSDTQVRVFNISNSADNMTADFQVTITPTVTVTTPNGGETWYTGSAQNITWTSSGFTGNVRITLNRNYPAGTWETLNSSTANDGTQAWTVSGTASSNARVRIVSVSYPTVGDTSNGNFAIASPFVTVTAPSSGALWYTGQTRTISWTSGGFTGNVDIHLNRTYPSGTWETLSSNTANDGSETWLVTGAASTQARIRVRSTSTTSISGVSDGNFVIASPFVQMLSPNGGEQWIAGEARDLTWDGGGFTGNVRIEINRDYPGGAWSVLFGSLAHDGGEEWLVTGPPTLHARLRVSSVDAPALTDVSDGDFSILSTPPTLVHDPLGDLVPGSGTITAWAYTAYPEYPIASVKLFYRAHGATPFDSLTLAATGYSDEFAADLSFLAENRYEYYLKAADPIGLFSTLPADAPAALYSFDVRADCEPEIVYDDGTAEWFNHSNESAGMYFQWAVKLGPLPSPYFLCGVRFAAARTVPTSEHTLVRVSVYAADGPGGLPGTLLYEDTTGSIGNVIGGLPDQTTWAYASLRDASGAPLVVNYDEFYVAVGNLQAGNYEAFGRDTDGTNAHRSVFYDPCEDQWFSEDDTALSDNAHPGNRMIRIQGYGLAAPDVTICRVGDNLELHWTDTGAPRYIIYAAASPDGPFEWLDSVTDTSYIVTDVPGAPEIYFFRVRAATE
ncbi:MAG: M6 family metalloprotease domain-containing protein [bacterium]|nr:M6 family metalloprotease domain-containing protein [bacterium]